MASAFYRFVLSLAVLWSCFPSASSAADTSETRRIDGYLGIWFDLGQRSEYGSKYSGGLATYTAKHRPLAVYSPEADKTFFVYGGTTAVDKRHLLAMVSYYDHQTKQVPKPIIVHDKQGVTDPHDNPSIGIDGNGHIWVFVSGRARARPGFKYRSKQPYSIDGFELVSEEELTYPQSWWMDGQGFMLFLTRYTAGRELYWSTSDETAQNWQPARKFAAMGGHYQSSLAQDGKALTMFNRHPGGNVDKRTDLYFLQTHDRGATWETVEGREVQIPLTDPQNPALVREYSAEDRLVYVKDIRLDSEGQPVLLYVTSSDHRPGPGGDPREWTIAHWQGERWRFHVITTSSHNYDMGSLYIEPDGVWRVIAPTEPGPQTHGTGGVVAIWESTDAGKNWERTKVLDVNTGMNHGYVRHPVHAHPDFYAYWSDGNPDEFSECRLYFTDREGSKVWRLPQQMDDDFAEPELVTQATSE